MRLLVFLLALLLAGGLWWVLRGPEGSGDGPRRPNPAEEELSRTENLHFTRGSEVLTVWVTGPDRKVVPLGAEVGIRHEGRTRWLYADDRGRRVFTDAPVGALEVLGRAPGYDEASQKLTIQAGVPAETIVLIRPAAAAAPTR